MDERDWEYLDSYRVGRLATVDGDGVPSAVPICFVGDGEAIYSPLDEKPKRVAPTALKRVRNILARPDVALVVDDWSEDWTRLAYLTIRGRADLLDPGAPEHAAAVARLRAKYPQYRQMALESRPLIRIRPVRARFWSATPRADDPAGAAMG